MDHSPTDRLEELVDVEELKQQSQQAPYHDRKGRWILALGVGSLLTAGVFFLFTWFENQERADSEAKQARVAQTQAKSLADQVIEACQDPNRRTTEIESLCKQAVDTKRNVEQSQTKSTQDVLTPEVVAGAVAQFCSTFDCKGADGEGGVDGKDAVLTDEQLLQAVTLYCGSNNCTGAKGADGQSVTEAQITAAVASYCATRNNCSGPAGKDGIDGKDGKDGVDGKDGPPGPAGRGVVSVICPDGSNDWVVTFSDNTTQEVDGPCRLAPLDLPPEAADPA